MRNMMLRTAAAVCSILVFSCKNAPPKNETPVQDPVIHARIGAPEEEEEGYDGAMERAQFEFDQIKDPALGYVPVERLERAVNYTEDIKAKRMRNRTAGALTWTERGPIYDFVGAYGNSRGSAKPITAGRTRAILIDTLNDPSGNTVLLGAVSGGLWKTTNFLNSTPNWTPIDDRFDNLAISSIAQDPTNPSVMYFSTGEAPSNIDAVYGGGVWKSVNGGATWTKLPATLGFIKTFKILCDAAGNVYLANRTNPNSLPLSTPSGLYRSKDGGASWVSITPASLTSDNFICTDIEISSTGRLHASFGYSTGAANKVQHQYTDDAANATAATGWNASTGIRINTGVTAGRLELAASGNTVYAITTNGSNNVDSCYKSVDGGATWTRQNSSAFSAAVLNTQGWYNITLAINPSNPDEIIMGGLDAYRSTNGGVSISRLTYWASNDPYVHADHHFMQWWNVGAQSRIVLGCDGGIFLSNDGGNTWQDRNRNLAIKQFYATALHPDAGSNYMLAGAQDNGVHQFTNPGLSWSTEVNGGDGCFVHINQQDPQVQFGSYVRNQYNRSTDGGVNWTSLNWSSTNGLFINPFDYDDGQNIMYASWGVSNAPNNQIMRWIDANTSTTASLVTLSNLARSGNANATAFKVSAHTKGRVFVGSSRGSLLRIDNASTVTSATVGANSTNITGAGFPFANLSCVNTGSTDDVLVAVFSNYGVGHVWYSTDGGANWTNIDGNLPDMPVRWAVFNPQSDNKLFLATEAGVYYTDAINGGSTVWTSDPGFPTVKTNMLKVRLSDNTILAATHGRGLYTATIPATPEIRFNAPFMTVTESGAGTIDCRNYRDYTVKVSSVVAPTGDATVTYTVKGGSTAVEGDDFDFTTNGNFSSPSKQHVFASGVGGTQNITVRVYDNQAVETQKIFTIGYTISGTTNAVAGPYNEFSFTINDNDVLPVPSGSGTVMIGNSSFGAYVQPLRAEYQKAKSQFIYRADELQAMGLAAGNITSLGLNVSNKGTTSGFVYNGFTISLKATNANSYAGATFESGATVCYTGNYSTVSGINTFNFSTPFYWDGTSNLIVEICFDNTTASMSADNVMCNATSTMMGIWQRSGTGVGCSLAAQYGSAGSTYIRPDIYLTGHRVNNPIETAALATRSTYLGQNKDVLFYNSNNVLARIVNQSAFSYGCTQVRLSRAGTGAVAFWNNNPANYLLSKTVQVTPTTNNASGQYQVTLYFTEAEKAGWEAATGNSWNNIKLIKTQGDITTVTPANPNAAGGVEIVTPTHGTYGAGYTLTHTFSTGFSSFGAGIPPLNPLPVTLMTFGGRLDNSTALLNWSTSTEQNSSNFDVEKSTDGVTFYKIGTVAAAGNSNTRKDYSFRDAHLSSENYYRLQMNDIDGKKKQSNVVRITYGNSVQKVTVLNNPFTNHLNIRFARQAKKVQLQLLTANGSLVAETQLANPAMQHNWQLPGRISAGSYILRSVVDGSVFTTKLVKP